MEGSRIVVKRPPAMEVVEEGFAFQRTGPVPHAAACVDYSWAISARRCRIAVETVLPDSEVEICFNFGPSGRQLGDRGRSGSLGARRAWVLGPHQENVLVSKETADCDILGVRLAPAVAAQLFGMPVSELAGQMVDLDAVWPESGALVDRLSASRRQERFALLEEALCSRLAQAGEEIRRTRALARRVATCDRELSMGGMAKELGIPHRTLIATFLTHLGLRPKTYQRVSRLRRAIRLLHGDQHSMARVALVAGYYDQSHLANDFRQMTGLTPSQYAAGRSWVSEGVVPFRLGEAPPGT